jgi:alkylation response protein AidB-like acyl-CoA dehydrogenase
MAASPQKLDAPVDHIQRVRALAPLFAAGRAHEDSARELDPALMAAMHQAGLFRMLLPTWLDGAALDPLTYTAVVEEIARHDASAAWCVNQGSGCTMVVGNLDRDVARQIFAPPDAVLSWGPSPGSRALKVEGGYRVNYKGSFASGSRYATWMGAMCPVYDQAGQPILDADGSVEVRTFLYPRAQADVKDVWHVVGLRGTGSDSFVLDNLFVPDSHTLVRDDERTRRDSSPHYRYSSTMIYSSGFAHVALGIARGFMADFMALVDKTPREARSTLRDNAIVQAELAHCRAKWEAARGYIRACVGDAWAAIMQGGKPSPDHRVAIRLAATFAIHAAKEVVDTLYDLAGSSSILENAPFERRFRDIHAVTQQLQGRRTHHYENVGRFMMGLPLDLKGAQI